MILCTIMYYENNLKLYFHKSRILQMFFLSHFIYQIKPIEKLHSMLVDLELFRNCVILFKIDNHLQSWTKKPIILVINSKDRVWVVEISYIRESNFLWSFLCVSDWRFNIVIMVFEDWLPTRKYYCVSHWRVG